MKDLRKIVLHGRLGKLFGRVHYLDVKTPREAIRALGVNVPGFREEVAKGNPYRVTRGPYRPENSLKEEWLDLGMGKTREIHIAPAPVVSGILEGVSAIAWFAIALVAAVGISLALMPSIKPPTPDDREDERESFIFDGGDNVSEQGHPAPLVYGFGVRVGSVVVSSGIATADIPYGSLPGQTGTGDSTPGWPGDIYGGDLYLSKGGGKGGGSSSTRAAQEDPNTLQSQATAKIIDLISEGEIGGLVNGLRSVYFDDTPVQNEDGSFNFKGIDIQWRYGLPDQSYIEGYPSQENSSEVGVEVNNAVGPITRTIADPDIDRARVTLRLNALSKQDVTNGDLKATQVTAAIDLQADGGGFTTVVTKNFSGKTVSPYQWSVEFPLPVGQDPWDIRVRRVTPDNESAAVQDDISWDILTSIIDAKLTYPDSAIVAITADAKQFGSSIPRRTYEIDGIKVEIPSNYNPLTRIYSGVWDGTFVRAVTDNPAWIFRDIVVNNRYGLGTRISSTSIDKWALYEIARRCDGLVPDGFGGWHPRHTMNLVIRQRAKAIEVLTSLASAFRSMIYLSTDGMTLTQDAPKDPTRLVTLANTLEDGEPEYSNASSLEDIFSAVIVWYNDPNDGYKLAPEVVEDPELRKLIGWKVEEITALGETRRGGAARFGRWFLEDQRQGERIEYKGAIDHATIVPGEVIEYSNPYIAGRRQGGRILSASSNSLALDKPTELLSGRTYTVKVMLPNGTAASLEVTNGPGMHSVLNLDGTLSTLPIPGAIWLLRNDLESNQMWRILGKKEIDELSYQLQGAIYDPTKYDRVELGLKLESPAFLGLATGQITAPNATLLSYTEFIKPVGSSAVPAILFSWNAVDDPRVIAYQLQVQRPGRTDWEVFADTSAVSQEVLNITPGTHSLRVRSIDALGRKSPWALFTADFDGIPGVPGDLADFDAYPGEDGVRFVWTPLVTSNPIDYEIRQGETWEAGNKVCRVQGDTITVKLPTSLTASQKFWIKAVFRGTEVFSENPLFATTYQAPIITRNYILQHDFRTAGTDWEGVYFHLEQATVDAQLALILSDDPDGARYASGDYRQNINLGAEFYAKNWVEVSPVRAVDASGPTWDDLETVTWDELGTLTWGSELLSPDDIQVTPRISLKEEPSDLIDGWTLDGTTTSINGETADVSTSLGTASGMLRGNGTTMTSSSRLGWEGLTLPTTFTLVVDFKPTAVPSADGNILFLENTAETTWLRLYYRHSDQKLVFENYAGARVVLNSPDWQTDDIYTFGITQTATELRMGWLSQLNTTGAFGTELAGSPNPLTLNRIYISNSGSPSDYSFDDPIGEDTFDDPAGDETFDEVATPLDSFPGTFADLTLFSTTLSVDNYQSRLFLRGKAGWGNYRQLIPGDYKYQEANIWFRVTAPVGVGEQVGIAEAVLNVDVPDIQDSGRDNVGVGGTTINFNRSFLIVPDVTVSHVGGSGPATARVTAITETNFTVILYNLSGTSISGEVTWNAFGY